MRQRRAADTRVVHWFTGHCVSRLSAHAQGVGVLFSLAAYKAGPGSIAKVRRLVSKRREALSDEAGRPGARP